MDLITHFQESESKQRVRGKAKRLMRMFQFKKKTALWVHLTTFLQLCHHENMNMLPCFIPYSIVKLNLIIYIPTRAEF